MIVETIKVYKGTKDVTINKTDLEEWNSYGFYSSSQKQKSSKKEEDKK